ncbi:hypothetical protein ACW9UR_21735 [Halovulum sp. GXIMD14794]
MALEDEYFGSPDKVALMRRSGDLWRLLGDDPRYSWYGRAVALGGPVTDTARVLGALARLQGAGVCYYFPKDEAEALFDQIAAAGFGTARHEHFRGGEEAHAAARAVVEAHPLPGDLTLVRLDSSSPEGLVAEVAALCTECGVMPVPGAVMRGVARRGITLAALDGSGAPVATAASYALHHDDSPRARDVFWGALATRPDRRGGRLALILGAMAILHMWREEGARGFMTGVALDNPSSQRLCNRLAVRDTEWIYAQCLFPELLGSDSITR